MKRMPWLSLVLAITLSACGGGGGGTPGPVPLTPEDISGLATGSLTMGPGNPALPDGGTFNFEQFASGDRILQRYPPSFSLMTESHFAIVETVELADGRRMAKVMGTSRNYLSGQFVNVTEFEAEVIPGATTSGAYTGETDEGTFESSHDNNTARGASFAEANHTWGRFSSSYGPSLHIDIEGNITGHFLNCEINSGQITIPQDNVNVYAIDMTATCGGATSSESFSGYFSITVQPGSRTLKGMMNNNERAVPIDLYQQD